MRIFRTYPFFIITLLLFVAVLAGFQTTLWFQVFGSIQGPSLWLLVLVYFAIYRTPKEALVLSYLTSLVLFFFGWMPVGLWLFNILIFWFLIWIVKERFFWSGSGYFWIAAAVSTFVWHVLTISTSYFVEDVSLRSVEFFNRTLQILLTPLFAVPIYYLIRWIEKIFDQPPVPQAGEALL